MNLPWNIKWHQVAISLLIGFTAGMLFGQGHPHENFCGHGKHGSMKEHMMKRFSSELHLTPEQQAKVSGIFDAKHPQMIALQAEMKPKFEALRNATQAEIRKVLTPDQLQDFAQMNARMEERWKERDKFFSS